jgi:hypothetical protein
MSSRSVLALVGAFGSGKTEVAINYARRAAESMAVYLVDLDVVTPYFRVGDYRERLAHEGIRVIAPEGDLASFELPAQSPEIRRVLDQKDAHVVLDVGGDPVGSRLVRVFADQITARGYDMWMVANPYRPGSGTATALVAQAHDVQDATTLTLTGMVANPHVGDLTETGDVIRGLKVVREAAAELGLDLVLAGRREFIGSEKTGSLPLLPLSLTVSLPWQPVERQE